MSGRERDGQYLSMNFSTALIICNDQLIEEGLFWAYNFKGIEPMTLVAENTAAARPMHDW